MPAALHLRGVGREFLQIEGERGMNRKVLDVIGEMEAVFEKAGEDFAFQSIEGEMVPDDDYGDDQVPDQRVHADWARVTGILERFYRECVDSGNMQDFFFCFAVYGNFYIRKGFCLRLEVDHFEKQGEWFGQGREYRECLLCLWKGIRDQEYIWFERALELQGDMAVAAMYLFVRQAAGFCQAVTENRAMDEQLEASMWERYEGLPEEYREYALGKGNAHKKVFHLAGDENWLPYINFCSEKEYMVSYILMFYRQALEKLGIDSRQLDSGEVYNAVIEKFQIRRIFGLMYSKSKEWEKMFKRQSREFIPQLCDFTADLSKMILEAEEADDKSAMPLTFLFEKLNDLSSQECRGPEAGRAGFCEALPHPTSQDPPAYRNMFLNIPVVLSEQITANFFLGRYELFDKNRQLKLQLQENQRLSREKRDMMDHYAHSWKHISYPMTVKRVAEELSRTNLPLANRLFKAYNSERTLQGGLEILQYSISDRPDALREAFRQGFYCIGASAGKTIRRVLEESADLVLFKVLMEEADGSRKISRCRANLQKNHSLEALREAYIRCYIQNQGQAESVLNWFDANVFPLEISVDALWQEIRIKEDEFADFQLNELFVELFTNVLTHGTGWCRISLESGEQSLDIRAANALGQENHGTQMGLKTLGAIVDKINFGTQLLGITSEIRADNVYEVKIAFDRRVMYRRGRR